MTRLTFQSKDMIVQVVAHGCGNDDGNIFRAFGSGADDASSQEELYC